MSITDYPPDPTAATSTPDRQVFTAAGTWTKPTGGTVTRVQLVAAGGGGGGGGVAPTGANRQCAGGGAAGMYVEAWFSTADLPGTVAITVGTGGTGGTGGAGTVATNGATGATGADTLFGTFMRAAGPYRAAQGGGGPNSQPWGGKTPLGGVPTTAIPLVPGDGAANGITPLQVSAPRFGASPYQPGGAASGCTITAANVAVTGADGAVNYALNDWGNYPRSGAFPGGNATPASGPKQLADVAYGVVPWYSGAGGAAGPTGAVGQGGNGSDAQGFGAGGGGGGPATTFSGGLATGGIGGRGAPGLAIITTY